MKQSDITPEMIQLGKTLIAFHNQNPREAEAMLKFKNDSGLSVAHYMALAGHSITNVATLGITTDGGFSVLQATNLYHKGNK